MQFRQTDIRLSKKEYATLSKDYSKKKNALELKTHFFYVRTVIRFKKTTKLFYHMKLFDSIVMLC